MKFINRDHADKSWIKHDPYTVDLFHIEDRTNHFPGAIRITMAVIAALVFINFF